MGTLDIILLVCFIPAVITGVAKGFVEQVVALASVILGAWLAFRFSTNLAEWLGPTFSIDGKLLHIICFAIIVILTIILLHLAGRLLAGVLKLAMLGWLNRLLGLVLAIANGLLVASLLLVLFTALNNTFEIVEQKTLAESVLYQPLYNFGSALFPYLKALIFTE